MQQVQTTQGPERAIDSTAHCTWTTWSSPEQLRSHRLLRDVVNGRNPGQVWGKGKKRKELPDHNVSGWRYRLEIQARDSFQFLSSVFTIKVSQEQKLSNWNLWENIKLKLHSHRVMLWEGCRPSLQHVNLWNSLCHLKYNLSILNHSRKTASLNWQLRGN